MDHVELDIICTYLNWALRGHPRLQSFLNEVSLLIEFNGASVVSVVEFSPAPHRKPPRISPTMQPQPPLKDSLVA